MEGKKLFSKKWVVALFMMLFCVWGTAQNYSYTFTSKIFDATPQTKLLGSVNWTLANNGGYYGYADAKGQQVGSGSSPASSMVLSTSEINGTITGITVNTSGASSVQANVSATVNGAAFGTAQTITSNNAPYTFTGSASGPIEIIWTNTSSKALYIKSIEVQYTTATSTAPVVTASSQTGSVGTPFSYQIQATENPTSYAVVSGTLPAGLNLDSSAGIISGTPTEIGSSSVQVTATNSIGTSAPAVVDFTINKGTQTITGFEDTVVNFANTQQITLPAATDQGLTVNYVSSNPSVASISGNILTFSSEGSVTVTATQQGNINYEALTVAKLFQAVSFCFNEGFDGLTGNNTASTGSNTTWEGNANFPTAVKAYQAGEAVKLGTGSASGSVTSLPLANIGGNVSVSFDVKGWSTVEGDIIVTLGGVSQTVNYTATMSGSFESKTVSFTNVALNSELTIATSVKRAFIDNVIVSCGTATVWDGNAWSNGTPDNTKMAIIAADYTGSGFEAAGLTVEAGKNANFNSGFVHTADVNNNGTINLENGVNFVQTGAYTIGAASTFHMKKDSKPVKRLNYIAWSSPMKVSTQTLKDFSYGNVNGANQSVTGTVDNRFYKYNNGVYVPTSSTGTFAPLAQGFFIRTPNDFTTAQQVFHGLFTGAEPNSGSITYDASGITGDYVYLGNPYPGAISISEFWTANPNTNGTVYIWNSQSDMNTSGNYEGTNYHTYTAAGAVPTGSIDGHIAAGQAFFVSRTNAQATFEFTNAMRVTANSGIFNKSANTVTDKFWLQLDNASGISSQMLMAFAGNGSENLDNGFDAQLMGNDLGVLYTKVNNKKLIIDTHANFASSDKFDVMINTPVIQNYTFSVAQKEGVFSAGQQIFLRDKLTGTVTDITLGNYSFTTQGNGEENRFEVFFTDTVLATVETAKENLQIAGSNGTVTVKSDTNITKVQVYDFSGRLIAQKEAREKMIQIPVSISGYVLVTVQLADGSRISRKVKL